MELFIVFDQFKTKQNQPMLNSDIFPGRRIIVHPGGLFNTGTNHKTVDERNFWKHCAPLCNHAMMNYVVRFGRKWTDLANAPPTVGPTGSDWW